MSTGSKIGIAFGAIIAGMLLGLLILWAYVSSLFDRVVTQTLMVFVLHAETVLP